MLTATHCKHRCRDCGDPIPVPNPRDLIAGTVNFTTFQALNYHHRRRFDACAKDVASEAHERLNRQIEARKRQTNPANTAVQTGVTVVSARNC